jgi:hypothetical protein
MKRRPPARLPPRERVLIVCEGEKTEPAYLHHLLLELRLGTVTVVGGMVDPTHVVRRAIERSGRRRGGPVVGIPTTRLSRSIESGASSMKKAGTVRPVS